jgi:class 3 adenylate cyclase
VLRDVVGRFHAAEVDTQGDAFFFAFARASDAVAAASAGQEALRSGPIRVRMGLHTGEPLLTEEGYVGIDVHRAARIAAAGHGAVRGHLVARYRARAAGRRRAGARGARAGRGLASWPRGQTEVSVFIASDLVAIVLVVVMTALVVVVVLGLHIWGAIQDGREEKRLRSRREDGL